MNDQINNALLELQSELTKIKDWGKLIKNAEKSSGKAIQQAAVSMQSAQTLVTQLHSSTQKAVDALNGNSAEIKNSVLTILEEYEALAEPTQSLVTFLNSISLPDKLEDIETSLLSVARARQTILINLNSLLTKTEEGKQQVIDNLNLLNNKIQTNNQQTIGYLDQLNTKVVAFNQETKTRLEALEKSNAKTKQNQNIYFGILLFLIFIVLGLQAYSILK